MWLELICFGQRLDTNWPMAVYSILIVKVYGDGQYEKLMIDDGLHWIEIYINFCEGDVA